MPYPQEVKVVVFDNSLQPLFKYNLCSMYPYEYTLKMNLFVQWLFFTNHPLIQGGCPPGTRQSEPSISHFDYCLYTETMVNDKMKVRKI